MPLSRVASVQSFSRGLSEDEVVLAYLQAGSFVKYLVEDISKKDTKPFMKFFLVDGDYKRNFGKSLEELEAGWREKIKNTKPLYALSDALKVEHLNARLKPNGELGKEREAFVKVYSRSRTISGGNFYFIWVDAKLESRTEHPIELVSFHIDNLYKGERVGERGGNYHVWYSPPGLKRLLTILGQTLEPNESPRTVPDFPIQIDGGWRGNEVVVHYGYKIPTISNDQFDTPVRMKTI